MVGRQHHEERILPQRDGVQVVLDGVDEETAVSVAAPHGLFQCIFVVDADQLQVDAWMLCEKALRDTGEPLDGGARERRHAHDAAFEVLELGEAHLQLALAVAHVLHPGKQIGAVRGEVRAAVVAHEQRHVQFSFERDHEVADAGLGVS